MKESRVSDHIGSVLLTRLESINFIRFNVLFLVLFAICKINQINVARVVLSRENYIRVKSRLNKFCLESRVSDHKGSVLLTRLVDVERTNSILFDSTFCCWTFVKLTKLVIVRVVYKRCFISRKLHSSKIAFK